MNWWVVGSLIFLVWTVLAVLLGLLIARHTHAGKERRTGPGEETNRD